MRLSHVLVASDLNPRYLESWPLVSRGWEEVAGLEPILVLVAPAPEVPSNLAQDPRVRVVDPLPEVHTAFQAQCIRLLYPALIEAPGAVLISDMELVPLDPAYFHRTVAGVDERFFAAYRGEVLFDRHEISIPYNAARPTTWAEIFRIDGVSEVKERLAAWAATVDYSGSRGGPGWYTDQLMLYETLIPWGERTARLWLMDDQFTGYSRLERDVLMRAGRLPDECRRRIRRRRYTDFDSCVPHRDFAALNEAVLELALDR
jgi:hypothetical protein